MLRCPECGSSELKFREAESSPAVKLFHCDNGHRFSHKTWVGKTGEFSGLVIATTVVARLFLDHHGILDVVDDVSSSL